MPETAEAGSSILWNKVRAGEGDPSVSASNENGVSGQPVEPSLVHVAILTGVSGEMRRVSDDCNATACNSWRMLPAVPLTPQLGRDGISGTSMPLRAHNSEICKSIWSISACKLECLAPPTTVALPTSSGCEHQTPPLSDHLRPPETRSVSV